MFKKRWFRTITRGCFRSFPQFFRLSHESRHLTPTNAKPTYFIPPAKRLSSFFVFPTSLPLLFTNLNQ